MKTIKVINNLVRANKVYESNDYDSINIYEYNRFSGIGEVLVTGQDIDFQRRLKKVKMMLMNDDFNIHLPIMCGIINGKLTTFEGNTRLIACKELGINFYYEVDETLNTIEALGEACFKLNNTGTKWNSTEKLAHVMVNPMFSTEKKKIVGQVIELSNRNKIALSTVLYVATNGNGHKAESLSKQDFKFLPDTESIILKCVEIASKNPAKGLSLLKRDKFIQSVMKAIRTSNNRELTMSNLVLRASHIVDQKSDRFNWNVEIQTHANFNLKNWNKQVHIL